ncbi:MAG: hypothetical protein U5Q44_08600 [Dehalococcoidia bacterium]|nr:hypothetical protein [Dehalococcoidia bacterium]
MTPFLEAATSSGGGRSAGCRYFIYQGALAFELWTGVPAPVDAMFDAARKELARRASMGVQ